MQALFLLLQRKMSTIPDLRTAIADVASDWREPDYPPRAAAVEETLEAPNRWTEEALTYALNRWMQHVTFEALKAWLPDGTPASESTVGVIHGAASPMDGFRDALAIWGMGWDYVGHVPEASPALLPTFADDLAERLPDIESEFVPRGVLFDRADAVTAQPPRENIDDIHEQCTARGIPPDHRLIRPPLYSVGILDGDEREDERDRMAEDMLLYEGGGRRRLAVLWAPRDFPPDPYLEAMARFRGVFPVHPDTPGSLQMQQAFLEARDEPHAYAEGLEFLLSRGAPQPQRPGHIRWSEYDSLEEVEAWIQDHQEDLYAVVARSSLHDPLPDDWPVRSPGGVHTPPLDDWEGKSIVRFMESLR